MRFQGDPLSVEEAYKSLDGYGRTYGELPLRLLLHVAVPQRFRADFVNLTKLNFLPAEAQGDLSLDADVLFAPVVEHLGAGYFRMDAEVRRQSLMLLDAAYRALGELRSVRVADLLLAYLADLELRAAVGLDPLLEEYVTIERWVAYTFLNPAAAAARFAWALKLATDAKAGSTTAALKVRFGSIAAAITTPLAGQQDLLEYARGYDALVSGRTEESARIFRRLGETEIHVGEVVLRPGTVLARLAGDENAPAAEPATARPSAVSPAGQEAERQPMPTSGDENAPAAEPATARPSAVSAGEAEREPMPTSKGKKTCFVVMGFGEKTDFQSNPQRVLNLNKTYEYIIEPAVREAGLECVRADKIIHSTVIDKPMYEQLLDADLVIADLSTSNANAIYELGVRHALRPHTTIVMAESNFAFPFDLSHLSILKYEHLGKEIGYGEVLRVKEELKKKITQLVDKVQIDSPVFLFLPSLAGKTIGMEAVALPPVPAAVSVSKESFAELMEDFRKAKADVKEPADWMTVIGFLRALQKMQHNDPYIIQQLALATYKSEAPDKLAALQKAKEILAQLAPETSSDAETVGLWGAVHKRLWEESKNKAYLDQAIRAHSRGYFFKYDPYNGINLAFLLDVRAKLSAGEEAIADRVLAKRIRREILAYCEHLLAEGSLQGDDAFWVLATKVEASFGLQHEDAERLKAEAIDKAPQAWMAESMLEQIDKLKALLS